MGEAAGKLLGLAGEAATMQPESWGASSGGRTRIEVTDE